MEAVGTYRVVITEIQHYLYHVFKLNKYWYLKNDIRFINWKTSNLKQKNRQHCKNNTPK